MKALREKVEQLWNIAGQSVCGRNVQAVAEIYCDIQRLFSEIERIDHASKNGKATAVHGHVCSCQEPAEELPAEESSEGVLAQAEGRILR